MWKGWYPMDTHTARRPDLPPIGDLYSQDCPCRDILDLVGSKWATLVIGRLEEQTLRFGELQRSVAGITQKSLTKTLRRLERDGLVRREVLVTKRPPQVEYSLTKLGLTATEPLKAIRAWSEQNMPEVVAAREQFDQVTA